MKINTKITKLFRNQDLFFRERFFVFEEVFRPDTEVQPVAEQISPVEGIEVRAKIEDQINSEAGVVLVRIEDVRTMVGKDSEVAKQLGLIERNVKSIVDFTLKDFELDEKDLAVFEHNLSFQISELNRLMALHIADVSQRSKMENGDFVDQTVTLSYLNGRTEEVTFRLPHDFDIVMTGNKVEVKANKNYLIGEFVFDKEDEINPVSAKFVQSVHGRLYGEYIKDQQGPNVYALKKKPDSTTLLNPNAVS